MGVLRSLLARPQHACLEMVAVGVNETNYLRVHGWAWGCYLKPALLGSRNVRLPKALMVLYFSSDNLAEEHGHDTPRPHLHTGFVPQRDETYRPGP